MLGVGNDWRNVICVRYIGKVHVCKHRNAHYLCSFMTNICNFEQTCDDQTCESAQNVKLKFSLSCEVQLIENFSLPHEVQ